MFALRRMLKTQWLLLPMFAALAMRVLIPVGWMPVFSDNGVSIIWCSGVVDDAAGEAAQSHHSGHAAAAAHEASHNHTDPGNKPADHSGKSTGVCTFATTAMAFADIPASLPLSAAIYETIDWLFPIIVAIGRGLAAPPPPQTGPPALS
jgi:hypothetical protein